MKKRAKITPFAKLVIALLIFLALRYLYFNQEDILGKEYFNFSDSTEQADIVIEEDTTNLSENLNALSDTIKVAVSDTLLHNSDTLDFVIVRSEDKLVIKSPHSTLNILLNDSLNINDTLFFSASDDEKIVGRVIIK